MATLSAWVVSLLMLGGVSFMLIATVGLVRLPDIYSRMQAATKAGAVGLSYLMLAVAIDLAHTEATVLVMLLVAFLLMTAPVAAHAIARAAYLDGAPLWQGTTRDDLRTSETLHRARATRSQGPLP
jgi:multicomponent Na+:H+ antiporter subunit G